MLFNSLHFLVFFPVVVTAYFLIPHRYRWVFLLIASSYFYMVFIPAYVFILFVLIIVDYTVGRVLEATEEGKKKKRYLALSLAANVGILFFFKYFNFFQDNIAAIAEAIGLAYSARTFSFLLPIGLSFHTFQSLAYIIEVYRGRQKAERHLGIYALYVMFFPQLVAGPIERPYHMLHQFHEKQSFSFVRVSDGLRRMLWGFFKKIVVADNLARVVDHVYNYPTQFDGWPLVIATVFFAFQLYADFSGYSDIAIGSAEVLGFRLMNNFDRPYIARSIADFWRRWHISLSSWFRDYVYIPLGGNRLGTPRTYVNIMLVFLLSGLWHGANWTYVVWGGINGAYLVISQATVAFRGRLKEFFSVALYPRLFGIWQTGITFVLAAVAFLFFRARTLSDAWYILTHLAPSGGAVFSIGVSWAEFLAACAAILGMILVERIGSFDETAERVKRLPFWIRWSAYNAVMLWIVFFGYFGEQPFIYFQF